MKKDNSCTYEDLVKSIPLEDIIENEILSVVASQLIIRRMELQMNQKAFARCIGLSQSLISKYENCSVNLTAKTIGKIMGKLGQSLEIKCSPYKPEQAFSKITTEPMRITDMLSYSPVSSFNSPVRVEVEPELKELQTA